MFGFQRKLIPRPDRTCGKGKCRSQQLPTRGATTLTKIKKCSVFNENRYQEDTWCEEKENAGPDNRRPVERPPPLKLRNVQFSTKIGTKTIFCARKRKMRFENNIHNGVAWGRSAMEGLEPSLPKMTYNTISREPIEVGR